MNCSKCGAKLESDAVFCTSCGAKVEASKNICSKCGAALKDDALFCEKCGAKVGETAVCESKFEQKPETLIEPSEIEISCSQPSGTKNSKTICFVAVVCIVLILCGVIAKKYIYKGANDSTSYSAEVRPTETQESSGDDNKELGWLADSFAEEDAKMRESSWKDCEEDYNKLKNAHERLLSILPKHLKPLYIKSQNAWFTFKKQEEKFAFDAFYNEELSGTSGSLNLSGLIAVLAQERTKELESYVKAINASAKSVNADFSCDSDFAKLDSAYTSLMSRARTSQKDIICNEYATELVNVNQREELQTAQRAWIEYDNADVEFLAELNKVMGVPIAKIRAERIQKRKSCLVDYIEEAKMLWGVE